MSETIDIGLAASTRGEVEAGMARLRAAGLDIEWRHIVETRPTSSADPRQEHVDGKLRLYDNPESAEAKFKAAGDAMRQLMGRIEQP